MTQTASTIQPTIGANYITYLGYDIDVAAELGYECIYLGDDRFEMRQPGKVVQMPSPKLYAAIIAKLNGVGAVRTSATI